LLRVKSFFSVRLAQVVGIVVGLLAWPTAVEAQRTVRCRPEFRVQSVEFTGSPRFEDFTMAASIVTQGPSFNTRWLRIGDAPCTDSLELRRDALRLAVMHRQAGWFQASVSALTSLGGRGLRVVFAITPGTPAVLDSLIVVGLPAPVDEARAFDAPLETLRGLRFDRSRVDSAVGVVLNLLRDAGYARAVAPQSTIAIDSATAQVTLALTFTPGQRLTLGAVQVELQPLDEGSPRVDAGDVRRLIGLEPGAVYRASRVLEAQRALYQSDAFRVVLIDTVTPSDSAAAGTINLRVITAEARTRSARVGLGWATQDCIRTQGRISNRGFLGIGRSLEITARASKIGIGAPTDFAPALCSGALRADPFSEQLNYYLGSTVSNRTLFGIPVVPVATLYSERRGEPFAYLRETTIGGLFEVSKQIGTRTAGSAGFQYENGKTTTDPVVSCSRFGQCRPEDYVLSLFGRSVAIASTSLSHDRANDAINPTRGWRTRGELRAGQTFSELVSSLRFYRTTIEGTSYFRFLGGTVGTRLQVARAFAPGAELVDGSPLLPPQERLFAGGQNSVRGYQQNLLGPLVYVVSNVRQLTTPDGIRYVEVYPDSSFDRAVPRGGTALAVANLEWRRSLPGLSDQLQFAVFIDGGNVWESNAEGFRWNNLRATPGLGLRIVTPLGPFRVDVGYQPYAPRAGRALFFTSGDGNGDTGQILCASPRTGRIDGEFDDIFSCPNSYQPTRGKGVLSRLAFHFGLGQAF